MSSTVFCLRLSCLFGVPSFSLSRLPYLRPSHLTYLSVFGTGSEWSFVLSGRRVSPLLWESRCLRRPSSHLVLLMETGVRDPLLGGEGRVYPLHRVVVSDCHRGTSTRTHPPDHKEPQGRATGNRMASIWSTGMSV